MTVKVPPIKSQGIKTKLVPWISSIVPKDFDGRWVEPFMGTGVVAFNVAPASAILCDTNPHLVNFYTELQKGQITAASVREYLEREGSILIDTSGEHYYAVRERFNQSHNPLDFLFLNRAGFNGMIRFNRKGGFNIPFCKKPLRFSRAYVTKIVNQVSYLSLLFRMNDFVFKCQDFETTLSEVGTKDIIYCDPPYIDRHVDYYNGWDSSNENMLYQMLSNTPAKFILSTWHHNDFRENQYIDSLWSDFNVITREHFYHVGASEQNRNPMIEAIVTNYQVVAGANIDKRKEIQLALI